MYNVINVVFTKRKLSNAEIKHQKEYAFIYDGYCEIGDLIESPNYATPMQVTNVYRHSSGCINGKPLKALIVDSINSTTPSKMKEGNSMFGGFVNKYKSQFIPQKEDSVRMSIQGTIVVPVNGEYVGMDSEGNLISYDSSMTIDVPVYSINTPTEKVQIGDIVKNGNTFGKVVKRNQDGSLKILSFSGYTQNKKEIKDAILGQSMTRVLVNMFNFNSNNTGFNPIMFAMAEGDKFDVKSLMMLSMMPEGKNLFNGINPMMLMMLDNNGGSSDLMSMMMLSQMNGNPFTPAKQETKPELNAILANPELLAQLKEALKD